MVPIDIQDDKPVDTKAILFGSRTYVPVRFVSEALDAKIEYEMKNGIHYVNINTGKGNDTVSFKEPEIIVTQMTDAPHVSTYFSMRLGNREDYKDTGINIRTELTNYPEFVKYRLLSPDTPGYFTVDANKYYSNWDYNKIKGNMGRFYELGKMTHAKKVDNDEPVTLPKDGFILKYKVTVTVGNETKVYNIDVPFQNKTFNLDKY